jgi:two-component system CheB/CheR fusion protein
MNFSKTNQIITAEPTLIMKTRNETKMIKVLVAEDIALNQMLIKLILADFGFECEIAENGKVVIEKLKESTYDVILMDLQMPEMNGFEATDYIRNTMNLSIPIIALTADVTSIDIEKSKKIGMNDYISKPIDEKLLYSKIIAQINKIKEN